MYPETHVGPNSLTEVTEIASDYLGSQGNSYM